MNIQDDVAIQIINYNTKEYLSACLNMLLKDLEKTDIKYSISVLDNNSNDCLTKLQGVFNKRNISFYFSNKNLGFGGGHNYLSKKNNAKYLLILNPDIEIIELKTVQRLFKKINNKKNIKVLGPKLLTRDKQPQAYDHGELNGIVSKIAIRSGNSYWKNRNKPIKCAWISGAVLLIEKQIFELIGGFDEKFFLYKEEEDLCLRVRQKGYEIFYDPTIKVMHYGSAFQKSIYIKKSVEYFLKKHFKDKFGYKFFKFLNQIIN